MGTIEAFDGETDFERVQVERDVCDPPGCIEITITEQDGSTSTLIISDDTARVLIAGLAAVIV